MRSGVLASLADLKQAKKSRESAAARASKKQAEKEKKEKERTQTAASRAAMQKVSPSEPPTRKIYSALDADPLTFVKVQVFDTEEEFKKAHCAIGSDELSCHPGGPCLIKDASGLRELLQKNARVASQLVSFEQMFSKSPQAKVTGRVQTAFSKAEFAEAIQHYMDELMKPWSLRLGSLEPKLQS